MRSPVRALVWEQWRQVWWTAPLSIVITAAVSFALHLDPEIEWYKDLWLMGSNGAIIASLALAGGLLLFAHSSPTDIRAGLPARHMTLPVRPLTLALSQYVFRFAFFVMLAFLLLAATSLVDESYAENVIPGTLYAACVISILMASVWTIGRRSMFLASAIAIGVAVGAFFLYAEVSIRSTSMGYVLAFAVALASSTVAVLGALRGHSLVLSGDGAAARETSHSTTRSFRHPIDAYRWFESRRKSRVVAYCAAAVLVPLVLLQGYDLWTKLHNPYLQLYAVRQNLGWDTPGPRYVVTTIPAAYRLARDVDGTATIFAVAPALIALIAGVCIALLDYRDGTLRAAHYVFTHPMSTAEMVRARFRFGIRTTMNLCIPCFLLSACLVLVSVTLSKGSGHEHGDLRHFFSSEYLLVLTLSFTATWALLWSPLPIIIGLLWLAFVAVVLDIAAIPRETPMRLAIAVIPCVLVLHASLRLASRYRRRQCPAQFAEGTIWLLFLAGIGLFGWSMSDRDYDETLPFAAAVTVALMYHALVTQPHWIERLRHGAFGRIAQRSPWEA